MEGFRTPDWGSDFLLSSAILPARLELVSDCAWSSMMPSSLARLLSGRGSVGSIADDEAAVSPFVEGGFCAIDQNIGQKHFLNRLTLDKAFCEYALELVSSISKVRVACSFSPS